MNIVPETKTIPILKLPAVPLSNILRNFNQLEIVDFSLASKKCQFIIKSIKFDKFHIGLGLQPKRDPILFYWDYYLYFEFSIDDLKKRNKYMNGGGTWSQLSNDENEMRIKCATVWADYVCDLFRRDIAFLYLNSNESLQEMSAITEWMNTRQTCLEFCEFSGDDTNSDIIDLFFEKTKFSIQNLCYDLRHTHEIRQFNCGTLDLNGLFASSSTVNYPVNWITEEDILTSNCVTIVIGVCYFNENNLNRVLKGWIDGNNPRMAIFTLAVKRLDFEMLLDGIEFEEKDESLKRTFES
ncbi:hypothetical protein CRE_23848 [Caenorhabditis remanei]|uniref:Uncharacterized protein n=1 Tax=Caenorhabditis remanei TaxID=31234 RepID=E3NUR5_CAERE|nr:hypothetical protein CRE_23848 [Caenorhabditis remanei]